MKDLVARITGHRLVPPEGTDIGTVIRDANLPSVVAVDAIIPVGQFFWIDTCIGMADNATHGHGVRNKPCPGSADVDCNVRVLDIKDDYAIVALQRPRTPYGALAPHGTIFLIPVEVLEQWPEMTARRLRQEQARAKLRQSLGSVQV